jgi:putative peptide zinc metalloprotease protein
VPYHSHAEGVLWLPEQAMVRADANGFLGDFLVQPGTRVAKGEALVQCYNPAANAQLRESEAKVAELQGEYVAMFATDRAKAQIARDKLDNERARLALARERAAELVGRANTDGIFIVPQMADMPGRYYRKGDLLGYVIGTAQPLVRVVIPQDAADKVRLATDRVWVRLVDQPESILEGKVLREVPAGGEYLPSPALAAEGGGEIATDPRDTKGPRSLQRMFQLDVALDGMSRVDHFGQRAFVRFEHQTEPLSVQWYRSIRLLFLSSFNV